MKTTNEIVDIQLQKLKPRRVFANTVFFMNTKTILFIVLALAWLIGSGQNVEINKSTINLRFVDDATGYSVVPENVEIKQRKDTQFRYNINNNQIAQDGTVSKQVENGVYDITVNAQGYESSMTYFELNNETFNVRFCLQPINPVKELSTEYIQSLCRPDAIVIVGFVVDDNTGKPLDKIDVYSADKIAKTVTNAKGFFQLILPLAENEKAIEARGIIFFNKSNYMQEVRQNFHMWQNGSIILQIRMQKGSGLNKVNIIENKEVYRAILDKTLEPVKKK